MHTYYWKYTCLKIINKVLFIKPCIIFTEIIHGLFNITKFNRINTEYSPISQQNITEFYSLILHNNKFKTNSNQYSNNIKCIEFNIHFILFELGNTPIS